MNNPYLLKNQLKENEEELSKYLRDMKIWHEQMKRKEQSPPIKNSGEKKKPKTLPSPKTSASKISSWDYTAWDKFDVDRACEELDVHNELINNNSDSSSDDGLNHNISQSKQSEALYEKNLGNTLVQKQKWAEAILRYTRAIEYYDKDPVFYANRALCYLKTNEYKLAINDCASSLKLDKTYVKAYQRRSAAYMSLGMYNKAKTDLDEVLKLEPNNKQAKFDIGVVNNKIIKQEEMHKSSDVKLQKTNTGNNLLIKTRSSNLLCKDVKEQIQSISPKWPSRIGYKQITSIQKPPHLRSKKPFCTPTIKDIQLDQEESNDINLLESTLREVCASDQYTPKKIIEAVKIDSVLTENKPPLVVPSTPQTYVQLKQDWAYLQKDSKLLFQYLKQIPGKRLPLIVRNSMDNELFVDILRILKFEFILNGYEITDYLIGISELPRLQMLVMFCSDNEVSNIKELLHHVSKLVPETVFKNLKKSFGVELLEK